ncbi:hypothetical protein MKL09_04375 [Methylobacterium sp. J-048]|uniref:hypothetical protein n=1 Tax=Methylobacterium sp. J-048 TaxID=2836635 RepID=UPI001FBBB5A8|nr:hypothetical protein [Methylobacterium sp. J-048]MCJ2055782.1 hypothetical protein [Methylobacterium sp. J-048]
MTIARSIIGTIVGIPRAVALAETDLDDLYEIAQALQDASNAVLCVALDVVALEEGYRIAAEYRRNGSTDERGSYGDAVRPGHRRLHQVRDCVRGVIPMYAQAFRLDVFWNTSVIRGR